MGEGKALRFVVSDQCRKTATGKNNKPYRQQSILVHKGEEVTRISWFLNNEEAFLDIGEYQLAPDAVFVGDVYRLDKKTGAFREELGLRIALRSSSFVKLQTASGPVSAPKVAAARG